MFNNIVIAYAAHTTTKRNLEALRRNGWRMILSPATGLKSGGLPYALDNGAWSAFTQGINFDGDAFVEAHQRIGVGADFVVLPDIVAGGAASLQFSLKWRLYLGPPLCPQLLAVQDGMTPDNVVGLVGPRLGIFLGGTTEWKLKTMETWGRFAKSERAYYHVGRVNTVRRIALCAAAGADSFDGSSVTRYSVNMPKLENARRQPDLLVGD